jgi:hypothetical protein
VQWSILNIMRHLGDDVQDKVAAIFDLRTWTKICQPSFPVGMSLVLSHGNRCLVHAIQMTSDRIVTNN